MGGLISLQGGLGILELCFREPRVFLSGVSFPLDEKFAIGRWSTVFKDLPEFILFFPVNKVREWHREIHTVCFILMIRSQKGGMED